MDNIINFEERQLIAHEARQWLVRLDSDTPLDEETLQALQQWKARSPAHRQELKRLSAFWHQANVMTELSVPLQSRRRTAKPWSILADRYRDAVHGWRAGLAAAAALLLTVFGINGWLIPQPIDATNAIYATAIGEQRRAVLVDGSIVQINTDSQVQVDYQAGVRKIRLLRGEAHFEVAHNGAWPFEVYAAKGRVKALGTAFLVQLERDDLLNVIVTDGQVEIAASVNTKSEGGQPTSTTATQAPPVAVMAGEPLAQLKAVGNLSKGQGVSYSTDRENPDQQTQWKNRTLQPREVARKLAWRDGYLVFNGESLQYVVNEINRYMPATIEIADPALSAMPVGGRFKVGELEALFDVLENNFGIYVSRVDDQHIRLIMPKKNP